MSPLEKRRLEYINSTIVDSRGESPRAGSPKGGPFCWYNNPPPAVKLLATGIVTKRKQTPRHPTAPATSMVQLGGPAPERTMPTSSIISRGTTSVTLQWENSSPWANPHPNGLYTFPVSFGEGDDCQADMEFFVSEMRLILKRVYHFHNGDQISYYNMGEFVNTVDSKVAVQKIKQYAQYVIDGYAQSGNLLHCPTFEMMDDVDDNFNPL